MGSGRKERWGPEAYAAVIKDIGAGIPLASCLGGKDRPGRTSFYSRLKEDAQLAADYEAAMQQRAEAKWTRCSMLIKGYSMAGSIRRVRKS
jgi:hypothetical protein